MAFPRWLPGLDSDQDKGSQNAFAAGRKSKPVNIYQDIAQRLTRACTSSPEIDSDLSRIVAVWPTLSEPIRRAMLALVHTSRQTECNG